MGVPLSITSIASEGDLTRDSALNWKFMVAQKSFQPKFSKYHSVIRDCESKKIVKGDLAFVARKIAAIPKLTSLAGLDIDRVGVDENHT